MSQLVEYALLLSIFCLSMVRLSAPPCARGTYLDARNNTCTNCPENEFMDEDNHTRPNCKTCRSVYEYRNKELDKEFLPCNATQDLYLWCRPNNYVKVEETRPKTVTCFPCFNCSNGDPYEKLPCNGLNDTLCCKSDDMEAVLNAIGIYECKTRPTTTASKTTMPTSMPAGGSPSVSPLNLSDSPENIDDTFENLDHTLENIDGTLQNLGDTSEKQEDT